jgi:hypothetical protein
VTHPKHTLHNLCFSSNLLQHTQAGQVKCCLVTQHTISTPFPTLSVFTWLCSTWLCSTTETCKQMTGSISKHACCCVCIRCLLPWAAHNIQDSRTDTIKPPQHRATHTLLQPSLSHPSLKAANNIAKSLFAGCIKLGPLTQDFLCAAMQHAGCCCTAPPNRQEPRRRAGMQDGCAQMQSGYQPQQASQPACKEKPL